MNFSKGFMGNKSCIQHGRTIGETRGREAQKSVRAEAWKDMEHATVIRSSSAPKLSYDTMEERFKFLEDELEHFRPAKEEYDSLMKKFYKQRMKI